MGNRNLEYKENYIESLREELVDMVAEKLSPIALEYGFSDVPLETNIKWKPVVLVLGNYSSGKSTLINELLGAELQTTGQAPTDDSFTVITGSESTGDTDFRIIEEREGQSLLNDPQYPFESLKKHGQRFAAHFRLKKVNSPILNHLAIIDTPGMLDSVSEHDRGYDYQEVIGGLAHLADLVLILFDPHKAGTVKEAYTSLRETLPAKTFEDRVVFVLNRIDECSNLSDLLKVYGTLCWNLSQMTGRKDIPQIKLTYSQNSRTHHGQDLEFLKYLDNQRDELKNAILKAPEHRLDHLASFVETKAAQINHFLEALLAYNKKSVKAKFRFLAIGALISLIVGGSAYLTLLNSVEFAFSTEIDIGIAVGSGLVFFFLWWSLFSSVSHRGFHRSQLKSLDQLTPLQTQSRKDTWQVAGPLLKENLMRNGGKFSAKVVRAQHKTTLHVITKGSKDIRLAQAELGKVKI